MSDPQYEVKNWLRAKLEPRGAKSDLGKAIGMSPDKITRSIELEDADPKKRRAIKEPELAAIARFYNELPPGYEGMTSWLTTRQKSEIDLIFRGKDGEPVMVAEAKSPIPNASFPPRYQPFPDDVSIPLRGQISAGPNGRFIMNGQDIARVFCPPGLEGVEGAYAVQVQGSSGEPRFYNGETAWVNPNAKYRQGDDVVVQILGESDEDDVSSYIKRYISQSGDTLKLYQYNPGQGEEHDLTFPTRRVFSIHKVVFHAML